MEALLSTCGIATAPLSSVDMKALKLVKHYRYYYADARKNRDALLNQIVREIRCKSTLYDFQVIRGSEGCGFGVDRFRPALDGDTYQIQYWIRPDDHVRLYSQ